MTKEPFIELDKRTREIFQRVVESYMDHGEPVGSRTLERSGKFGVSSATIRNVLSDLEEMGLLYAPHTSAGRLPTDQGLRYFVDGILEIGDLPTEERRNLEKNFSSDDFNGSVDTLLETVGQTLSGLSSCAGLVAVPKIEKRIKHIEFRPVDSQQALAVIVATDGDFENRLVTIPPGVARHDLEKAGNYLTHNLSGRSVQSMRKTILEDIKTREAELGALTTKVIEAGLATRTPDGKLIVHGRAKLFDEKMIDNVGAIDSIRDMIDQLDQKEIISQLLEKTGQADGIKIFIGSENDVLRTTGHSLILSPYTNGIDGQVVGTIGVIGPTRLNYANVIPRVNVLADILSQKMRMIGERRFAPSLE